MTKPLPKMSVHELTDQIYDTLMGNVGLTIYHLPFLRDRVRNQWCDGSRGIIEMTISRKKYIITVREA